MPNTLKFSLLALLLIHVCLTQAATPIPAPPQVAATSHLLMDADSGHIISQDDADKRRPPASLTKIMTAYVVFRELKAGHLKLTDKVRVSKKAWRTGGSKMFIEVGKEVSVNDLLHGLIIQSGNDAGVALAEHVAGSEEVFAQLMNSHAKRLGMRNSHFVNATGWPAKDHYTTVRDLAMVSIATIREFPELYKLYSIRQFKYGPIKRPQRNRNRLLWRDDSVDGLKTGHTQAAGYCLVASAKRDGMRLLSVVMGTKGEEARARETLKLLNYGFRFFETHRLYGAGDTLVDRRVWKGQKDSVPAGLRQDLYVTIPRRRRDDLVTHTDTLALIDAPVSKGQRVGTVTITLDGKDIAEVPLVALVKVEQGGIFTRAFDSVMKIFQ